MIYVLCYSGGVIRLRFCHLLLKVDGAFRADAVRKTNGRVLHQIILSGPEQKGTDRPPEAGPEEAGA